MMYSFWDMKRDRHIFLPFWAIFCSFTPLTIQKMKILKNGKTPGDIIILHKCTKNHDYMLYCSWDMVCNGCNCCFSLWSIFFFFLPFYPLPARKIKILKRWKNCLGLSSFYTCVPKIMIRWCSWDMVREGRTDGQKKWHILRWVPHIKITLDVN